MKFSELVDIDKLGELCESFTSLTGAVTAILDLEGEILTATGWQDICTRFHRAHPATAHRCLMSDTALAGRLEKGERYNVYKCRNGLIDVAVPITIGGEHVANFFTGQFFFEPPEKEYFIRQAEKFGFDRESYIEALDKVPIFSEDKVRSMMEFFTRLAQLIGEMGLARKNQEEANAELRRHQERLEERVMERTGELSRANRELQEEIAERRRAEEELRRSEERYRRLYNDTPVMLHSINHDGRLVSVSNYWLEMLGYERDEVLGRKSTEFLTAASRLYAKAVLSEFYRTGLCKEVPYQIVRKNGEILDVLLSATAEKDREGKVVRSLAVMIDVTERKRAEEEIDRLNADLAVRASELEDTNRELEAFNYTVAHDLRKPLTVINGYFQLIRELCGDKLDEACNSYLREAYDGTWRMNRLIDALLNFSRLAHIEPRRETVDLSGAAQAAAAELQLAEPDRRVAFLIADRVRAEGDAGLLRVVLDNLLGNAWKFTGTRDEGIIEFGTTEVDGKPAYFVRDNGAGFEMAAADNLFAPFRRLPGAEEGFGIGLATVERIIQRHGGRVWAEGEPGKGATFYFTLPRRTNDSLD